jgi:hypothetical protein
MVFLALRIYKVDLKLLFLSIFTVNLFANYMLFEYPVHFSLSSERQHQWNQLFHYSLLYKEDFYHIHLTSAVCLFLIIFFTWLPKRGGERPSLFPSKKIDWKIFISTVILIISVDLLPKNLLFFFVKEACFLVMLAAAVLMLLNIKKDALWILKVILVFGLGFLAVVWSSYDNDNELFNRGAAVKYTVAFMYGLFQTKQNNNNKLFFALSAGTFLILFVAVARIVDAQNDHSTQMANVLFDVLVAFEHTIVRNVQLLNDFALPQLQKAHDVSFIHSLTVLIPFTGQEKGLSYLVTELYTAVGYEKGGFASGMLFQGALNFGTTFGVLFAIIFSFMIVVFIDFLIAYIRKPVLKTVTGVYFATIIYDFYRYDFGVILRKIQFSVLAIFLSYLLLLILFFIFEKHRSADPMKY